MLKKKLESQGSFLFRWRSYLPFVLVPSALIALSDSAYIHRWLGEPIEEIWDVLALAISLAGLAVRAHVVGHAAPGTSGRNTRRQRAKSLNTSGLYSVVRNPIYLGNFLVLLGFVLAIKSWWFAIMTCSIFVLYYERIMIAEERYLNQRFSKAYREWSERTPLFVPDFRLWKRPDRPFSIRTVLRREYNGLYLIIVVFTAIEVVSDVLGGVKSVEAWVREDFPWLVLLGAGTLAFAVLRYLKKRTSLLKDAEPEEREPVPNGAH